MAVNGQSLKSLRESQGVQFPRAMVKLLQGGDVKPEQVSIRELYEATVGPVSMLDRRRFSGQPMGSLVVEQMLDRMGVVEEAALGSTMFDIVTTQLLGSKAIEGYESVTGIGDQLMTTYPSTLKDESLPGFTAADAPDEVPEGKPYPEATMDDKQVGTSQTKYGRAMKVTKEAVIFDQTGMLLMRANRIGVAAGESMERIKVRGVQDADYLANTTGVWRPNKTLETLFNTDGSNYNYIGVGNTTTAAFNAAMALQDISDVGAVLNYAVNIVDDRVRTADRQPILWTPKVMLVPVELNFTAARITTGTEIRETTNTNTQTLYPNIAEVKGIKVLSSPFVSQVNAANWYLGDPQKQFVWKEIWPLITVPVAPGSAEKLSDVVSIYMVSFYGAVVALDEKYWVMVDGA